MEERLEQLWRNAAMKAPVCILNGITKNDVLFQISEGATSLDELKCRLPLCKNNECKAHAATARGCSENAQALLEIYAPIWKMMSENRCSH